MAIGPNHSRANAGLRGAYRSVVGFVGHCLTIIGIWLVVNLFRDLALNVSRDGRVLLIISRHRPSLKLDPGCCRPDVKLTATQSSGWPPVSVPAGLLLRFRGGSSLDGVLLGAQSLGVVLFLGLFLVDDRCEELLHFLGNAGR